MSSETSQPDLVRRRALKVAVAALISEVGFSHSEDAVLETLSEMMQSYLCELGRSCRAFAELSSRTEPMLSDVVMSLIDMGCDVQSLPGYSKRPNKTAFMPPGPSLPTPTSRTLQAGQKKPHPSYIPDHLPTFPDPHTYIKTPTYKKPITEYQLLREKAASQKRDVERALTRFIAKTGETENLFPDDPYAFPLIACQPKEIPYLEALIPKDFDLDSEDSHAEHIQQQQQQKRQENQADKEEKSQDASKPTTGPSEGQEPGGAATIDSQTLTKPNLDNSEAPDEGQIDNPYLRPIRMPRLAKGGKSKSKY